MFAYQKGKTLSLRNMCVDLRQFLGIKMKKQSLDERFTEKAVTFLKAVLASVMGCQLKMKATDEALSVFNRVRVKDSTRFALPGSFSKKYKGHGGATANSSSMVSIQYEYDMLSGDAMDLRLTSGTKNDQGDSKNKTHDIRENDLFIRDLGYATLTFMSLIINKGAYFLNRLNPQMTAYHQNRPDEKVDFAKCRKKMKKHNLPYLTYEVLLTAYTAARLGGSIDQSVTLHTLHWLEGSAQGASMFPRLAGFTSLDDRRFFELFTTCKGIGHRKALRAMTLSTGQIASAIADRDVALLKSLPEVGTRTAETIVATLRGKVDAFISADGSDASADRAGGNEPTTSLAREATEVLVHLGENRAQVVAWIDQAMREGGDPQDVQDLVARVYQIKAGG